MSDKTIGHVELLCRLADDLDEFKHLTEGPIGTIYNALAEISAESLQGSNQAASDPEDDTLWTDAELEAFIKVISSGLDILAGHK